MKYIKMDACWYVLETKEKIPFGEIIVSLFNYWKNQMNEYEQNIYKLLDDGYNFKSKEMKEMEAENPFISENYDIIYTFTSVIEIYLIGHKGKNIQKTFKIRENSKLSSGEQILHHKELLEKVKNNGWDDISEDDDISIIDIFLLNEQATTPPFMVSSHLINYKWYPAYEVYDNNQIYFAMLDLQEVRNINGIDFAYCKYCDRLYIKRNAKNKYCSKCSNNYKAINDKKRKSTPRGLHQKVSNYLRNSYKFTPDEQANFNNESNYYWENIKGKTQQNIDGYLDISSVQDYIQWLENKHQEFKKMAKTRKKC